jgi:glutamyl-tRNA reductase
MFAAGISFKTAPVELREGLAIPASRLAAAACELRIQGGLSEVVILSTCNRVELYGVSSQEEGLDEMINFLVKNHADARPYVYVHKGDAAARHLFSVASGLDSMVLGETEITGQVKIAYESAQAARTTGRVTNCLFQRALQAAKAIRTKTQIGRGATSVGSVAVQLAEKIFGSDFCEKTVMIIGAGKMGEACVRHLAKKGAKEIIVANRTIERAQELAGQIGARAVNYMDDGLAAMREADIVVSSTGCPETILDREDVEAVMRARPQRALFLIDIAVPRDVAAEVQEVENVFLYNIDHLEAVVRENVRLREQELRRCREIIDKHVEELVAKLDGPRWKPAVARTDSGLECALGNAVSSYAE